MSFPRRCKQVNLIEQVCFDRKLIIPNFSTIGLKNYSYMQPLIYRPITAVSFKYYNMQILPTNLQQALLRVFHGSKTYVLCGIDPQRAKVRSIKIEFCIIFAEVRTTNQLDQIPHLKSLSKQILKISAVNLIPHYHFTRLNPKKKDTLQFCLPALLGIHRNSKQKEFFSFSEGFLI